VFHVHPGSTLAHTVAKVVATKSHRSVPTNRKEKQQWLTIARLWVTDPLSPSSSGPPTPSHSSVHIPLVPNGTSSSSSQSQSQPPLQPPPSPSPPSANYSSSHLPQPYLPVPGPSSAVTPSIPASALPGARLSGRLVGVVSLTDILNLHARASGLSPADPAESRSRRRRSSSSSVSVRRSGEIGRELFGR
jgi:hypothetical protein